MKTAMVCAALGACAVVALSLSVSAQAQTTVIPGKDDSTVIINRDGKAPVVLDVNKDIKGTSAKPPADKPARDAEAKSDAGVAADTQDKPKAETTGQDSGSIKAECVTKTGKESWSVDSTKGKCN